jgi:hypothetical protein
MEGIEPPAEEQGGRNHKSSDLARNSFAEFLPGHSGIGRIPTSKRKKDVVTPILAPKRPSAAISAQYTDRGTLEAPSPALFTNGGR